MRTIRAARVAASVITLIFVLAGGARPTCAASPNPPSTPAPAQPADVKQLKDELDRLRADYDARLRALEQRLAEAEAKAAAGTPASSAPTPALLPTTQPATAARKGLSNPDIGVVGDFHANWAESQGPEVHRNLDFDLSEVEVSFASVVDPWVRFDVFGTFHGPEEEDVLYPSGAPEEGDEGEQGLHGEIEEAYVTTLGLPGGLQLRGGRFRQKLGPYNGVHPHDQPFADEPTVLEAFLGEDLIDDGVELSWLTPAPFYWELSGSALRGPAESPTFSRSEDDAFLYTGHSKLFFTVTPHSSLELGQSIADGPGGADGSRTSRILGADLSLKWRPTSYRGITWITEWLQRDMPVLLEPEGLPSSWTKVNDRGAYTYLEGRITKRNYLGARLDWLDYDDSFFADPAIRDRRDASLVYQFWPSEFQTLKFQWKHSWDDLGEAPANALSFNWVWIMGVHGAHKF